MTTGEYLVAHSTLPSGTALDHLLAIQGTGQAGVVFVSFMSAVIDDSITSVLVEPQAEPQLYFRGGDSVAVNERDEVVNVSVLKQTDTLFIGERPLNLVVNNQASRRPVHRIT